MKVVRPAWHKIIHAAEGLSQSEIAKRLNQPLGTIKGRARLALQKLKASLASGADVAEGQQ
jgi:DNA-directed RNA polymerase specialized sigma24 family protein